MALALGLTAASNVADIAGEGISRTLFGLASVIAESAKVCVHSAALVSHIDSVYASRMLDSTVMQPSRSRDA